MQTGLLTLLDKYLFTLSYVKSEEIFHPIAELSLQINREISQREIVRATRTGYCMKYVSSVFFRLISVHVIHSNSLDLEAVSIN